MTLEQAKAKLQALPTPYQIGRERAEEVCKAGDLHEWEHLDLAAVISAEYERGFWDYANAWKVINNM